MLLAWTVTRPNFFRRAVGEATPGALGAIRALVLGRLLFMVLGESLATLATIPDTLRRPMGVIEVLFALPLGLDHLVRSAEALHILQITAAVLLFLATIGWRTRRIPHRRAPPDVQLLLASGPDRALRHGRPRLHAVRRRLLARPPDRGSARAHDARPGGGGVRLGAVRVLDRRRAALYGRRPEQAAQRR